MNLSRTIVHALPVFVVVANTKGRIMKFDEARVYASDKLYAYIKQLELYIDNGYVDKEDGEQTLLEFKERVEQYNKYVKNL